MTTLQGNSAGVLRYLGRPLTAAGKPHANSNSEVMSRVLNFHDGLRVRHWVDHNSVKVYNEQNVLRIETTINQPYMFKVWRRAQGQDPNARKKLRDLRKGVADIPLRAQISQEVNNRLMDELSTFTVLSCTFDLPLSLPYPPPPSFRLTNSSPDHRKSLVLYRTARRIRH